MTPKELVARWVERFNAGDVEGLAALYHEDAVNHQVAEVPVEGRDAIREMFRREFAAAEMVCIPEVVHEAGDVAILEWRDPLGLRGCGFFTVRDDRIAFQRGYWDKLSFLRAHGAELDAFYRRYNDACNAHRFDDFAEFVSPEVVINGTDRGLEAYTGGLRSVTDAFPDYRWELRHLVTEPPWIAAHLWDTGTHEATGRAVEIDEFALYRVQDGRIAEVWGMAFHVQLLEQIR